MPSETVRPNPGPIFSRQEKRSSATVERSGSLVSASYGNVGTAQTGTTGQTLTFTDAAAAGAQGFYRVQVDP